jgi:hypothetical protein
MKRFLLGLVAAAVIAFGAGLTPASASTINVNPNPTDSFHVGNFFPGATSYDDTYQFTLTHDASATSSIVSGNLTFAVGVFDPSNNLASLAHLFANVLYTLHVSGFSGPAGGYGGTINFTQVAATPIPSAGLLMLTMIGGVGFLGYRRKQNNTL